MGGCWGGLLPQKVRFWNCLRQAISALSFLVLRLYSLVDLTKLSWAPPKCGALGGWNLHVMLLLDVLSIISLVCSIFLICGKSFFSAPTKFVPLSEFMVSGLHRGLWTSSLCWNILGRQRHRQVQVNGSGGKNKWRKLRTFYLFDSCWGWFPSVRSSRLTFGKMAVWRSLDGGV